MPVGAATAQLFCSRNPPPQVHTTEATRLDSFILALFEAICIKEARRDGIPVEDTALESVDSLAVHALVTEM